VFHARVYWPGYPPVYVFNLSEEAVRERFVGPWDRGEAIVVRGQQFNVGYWQVQVYQFQEITSPGSDINKWVSTTMNGTDVTDAFITAPYGSRAPRPAPSSEAAIGETGDTSQAVNPSNVMVVHGRDLALRDSMFMFLRSIGLSPMEWSQLVSMTGEASPYIGQVLERAFEVAQAAVVLFSPDDEARLVERLRGADEPQGETDLSGQAKCLLRSWHVVRPVSEQDGPR
jgi:hypothetical protein